MANGANWSALGAAILGGNNAFNDRKVAQQREAEAKIQQQNQLLQQQMLQAQVADLPNQQAFQRSQQANTLATAGLNQKLLTDKVNELPQQHAEQDVTRLTQQLGDDRFDSPQFLDAATKAGMPFPTKNVQQARVRGIESGAQGPVPTTIEQAQQMGVAPNTGAVIPSEVRLKQQKDQQGIEQSNLVTNYMKSLGGAAPAGPTGAPAPTPAVGNASADNSVEPPFEDPEAAKARIMGKLTGIDTGAGQHESAAHKLFVEKQAAELKTKIPAAMMQRVTGQMGTMVGNLETAQHELENMYPGIQNAVKVDTSGKDTGTGAYNGALDFAKAKGNRLLYNYKYTPLNKAIQAASLANVTGWGTIVPGRINAQIVDKLKEHQSAYGTETPLATYQRNKELIEMTKRNRDELLGSQPLGDMGAAPAGRPPIQVDAASVPPRTVLKAGDPIPMSEVTNRAKKAGLDPRVFAGQLHAAGVIVLMDR